jgi:hypothetical protein
MTHELFQAGTITEIFREDKSGDLDVKWLQAKQ